MKVLLVSDMAETGFGRVGRELGRRFLAAGVDLKAIAVNWRGVDGELVAYMRRQPRTSAEIGAFVERYENDPLTATMIPAHLGGDPLGTRLLPQVAADWNPDVVLIVADPRAIGERVGALPGFFERQRTFNYVPVEGWNLPLAWRAIWRDVTPVAMSAFGQRELATLLGRDVANVPHGISAGFYPVTPARPGANGVRTKAEAKALLPGAAGKTVILRTDRFVPRKNYPALFRSMAPVLERHSDALLVVHCATHDEGGLMAELVSKMPGAFMVRDSWRHPQVHFTGGHDTFTGYPDEQLNLLYNAADIFASPTKAEGFGLTLAEAAACGVPVVTTDFAAGPEVVGAGGLLIQPATYTTNEAAHDWALVDEPAFGTAVESLIADPKRRVELGLAGVEHVRQFSWDTTATQILDLMA